MSELLEKISGSKRTLITAGPLNYEPETVKSILQLSSSLKCPVAPDGLSRVYFNNAANVINNFSTMALSSEFKKQYDPELIIHFGNAYTSNSVLDFFKNSKAYKIVVNQFGDKIDPTRTTDEFVKHDLSEFCGVLSKQVINQADSSGIRWHEDILLYDAEIEQIKSFYRRLKKKLRGFKKTARR